jgi:hypothetical protein
MLCGYSGQERRLEGLIMEILDSGFSNLGSIVGTTVRVVVRSCILHTS